MLPCALGDHEARIRAGPRQHQRELFATEARDDVALAYGLAESVGHHDQSSIARGVAVLVVDTLEVVDVEQDQADRP